jgi:ketosteroid isomerase-like protein
MSSENVELVRGAWDAWERGDMEALFEFYDPTIVWDQTHYAQALDFGGVYHGHDGIKQFFRRWLAPFDEFYAHAEEFLDAGEAIVVRVRQGGRGKTSGATVEMPIYWQVYRLRDGRVVRIEVFTTRREAFDAVGLPE